MAHGFERSDGGAIGSGLAARGEATLEERDSDLLDALEEGRVGAAAEAELVFENLANGVHLRAASGPARAQDTMEAGAGDSTPGGKKAK